MTEIICTALSGIATIIVAVIGARLNKNAKEEAKRAERRKQESILSLEMMAATMELSVVSANALTGGHNNGNVAAAKERAEKAHQKYIEFERNVMAEEIA